MRPALVFVTLGLLVLSACSSSDAGGDQQGAPVATAPADGGQGGTGDSRAEHFYVVNTLSQNISVLEAGGLIDTIELGAQPHGQGPSSRGDRLYVTTDGTNGEVIALDTQTREVLWRLDAGDALNEPHLTRDDRFLFAPDLLAARTVIVDVEIGEIAGEVAMIDPADGSNLVALHNTYASHDGERMYVTAILSNKIAEISVATRELTRIYQLSGQPRPAAITEDDRKMYVQLSELHGFIELDLETGEETARIEWPDDGTRPPGFEESAILTKCHGIGITPDGSELWAASNLEGNVRIYSLPALDELAVIEVGIMPNWVAFTRDGSTAYVTNTDPAAPNGTVSVVDVRGRVVTTTVDVGTAPKRVHRVDLPLVN